MWYAVRRDKGTKVGGRAKGAISFFLLNYFMDIISQNRVYPVPFRAEIGYLSGSGNDPRTPSDWPARATTRRWPHFRRVHPILATQHP